jgi:hypothetical protein
MLQHALDDIVGTPTVLCDLFEVTGEHLDRLVDLGTLIVVQCPDRRGSGLLQFVEQLDGEPGEIVDEIERVLDLVCDPCG